MYYLIFIFLFLYNFSYAEDIVLDNGGSSFVSVVILLMFFCIFYFLLIRPQIKKNNEQKKVLSSLNEGDEVLTSSGFLGKIVKIGVNYICLEISENVVIKIQKNSILNLLPKGSIDKD